MLGNGSISVFPFNFVVGIATNFSVYYNNGTTLTLLSPAQYTLSLTAPVAGQIWGVGGTVTYPTSGPAIANGTSLTFSRIVPLTQLTSVSNQGALLLQTIETALDTLCLEIQQVSARTGQQRGVWQTNTAYNFGDIVQDGVNGTNTLNYYMCAISNTSGTWATDLAAGDWSLSINVQQIAAYATAAAASATAAASSASNAATSASSAATSASSASTSATNAASSATSASASATSASASAATATTQATNASTSATSAASSATSASTSATTATTQATNASTSATSASTSATSAAASATAASASAIATAGTLYTTSTSPNTIGTGNFTFTVAANKNFIAGQPIIAASNANGANYIHGYVNSYSGTTLVITETDNGGSGSHSDWNISVSGTQGPSGGGTGTVTTVSVVSANGLSGSVANPTTTPAITLSVGAINLASATALPLTTGVTGILPTANGGTANGFFTVSGPSASAKTFTFPNASANVLTDNAAVTVAQGGTGVATTTVYAPLFGGTTTTGPLQSGTVGSSGQVLTSNGAGALPTFQPVSAGELTLLATATASSSATLDFTSVMSSAYDQYLVVIEEILKSTSSHFDMYISVNNGSTFTQQMDYQEEKYTLGGASAPVYQGGGNVSPAIIQSITGTALICGYGWLTSTQGANGTIFDFNTGARTTGLFFHTYGEANQVGSPTNAIRFAPSAGNFTSGKIYLYGVKNT